MTVVDQASRVPAVDATAISRLTDALDHPEVLAAFLFGSQARGTAGPLSDIDVAILHADTLSPDRRLDLRLGLMSRAGAALATGEVDIVLLNAAPPLLRDRVLRDGLVLIDRDPDLTARFRQDTARDYAAGEPDREKLSRRLRQRIQDGNFGRRP
jgi:predicted nucleotidyltransferase